jgi:hypothetical protein
VSLDFWIDSVRPLRVEKSMIKLFELPTRTERFFHYGRSGHGTTFPPAYLSTTPGKPLPVFVTFEGPLLPGETLRLEVSGLRDGSKILPTAYADFSVPEAPAQ